MRKISLQERIKSYKHLTLCIERVTIFRAANFDVMSREELLDSYNNEKFLNQSLDNVKEQIIILTVDKFERGEL